MLFLTSSEHCIKQCHDLVNEIPTYLHLNGCVAGEPRLIRSLLGFFLHLFKKRTFLDVVLVTNQNQSSDLIFSLSPLDS